jgi:hypothetical protein
MKSDAAPCPGGRFRSPNGSGSTPTSQLDLSKGSYSTLPSPQRSFRIRPILRIRLWPVRAQARTRFAGLQLRAR